MIVYRYLTREILTTMGAVTGVLLLVIMGNKFIRYFSDVAEGEFPAGLLGSLMLYNMPSFVQLILPLAFFLGIMLAYGQLYLNSEMTVLAACGISPRAVLGATLWPAALVAVLVGACSLWLTPYGLAHNETMLTQQEDQADFSALAPGRFQEIGDRTVYAESTNGDDSRMNNVFIAESDQRADGSRRQILTRGESGYQTSGSGDNSDSRYLVLSEGARYAVTPGDHRAERLKFETYALRLQNRSGQASYDDTELLSTPDLLARDDEGATAALQWRVSLALMVPILTLIALPLSRASPRQGRFAKLLPAIFIYIAYMSLLLAAQDALSNGRYSAAIGMWPIHAVFLLLGLWLSWRDGVVGGRR
ncbi:lipopolysaccharide export system permease protein [Kushneria sinocarnis]|uniref:Lipopolysaccharide export system permease protein LptF n=1 Tax=Kushneria sinocarnis TaxID=595502 RepID=A0A420WTJ4_9GAMM|nr:LPS export ABC transporter permease LptF [Kushneria sinocarnis]RKQ96847.1 lipopolysaccharide export system permease protein [Kushneria sinocarnis]